jgi:hypothetical protein
MNSTQILLAALERYEAEHGQILSDTQIEEIASRSRFDSTQSENKNSFSSGVTSSQEISQCAESSSPPLDEES